MAFPGVHRDERGDPTRTPSRRATCPELRGPLARARSAQLAGQRVAPEAEAFIKAISRQDPAALELGYRTSNLKHTDRAVVLVAEQPLTCVVRGCGMALERMERLGTIFTSE